MNRMHARFLSVFVLGWSLLASADTYFVEAASGSGVAESDLETATELVRTAVSEVGEQSTLEANAADYLLRPRLLRLGDAYILQLQKTKKGTSVFSSQLKAANLNELDKVATRLTRSVIQGGKASKDLRVGEITDQEARDGTQRRPARQLKYFGIGGGGLGQLAAGDIGYGFSSAYAWDLNDARLKIFGDFMFQGSALWLNPGIAAAYFFSTRDVAPFVGADFGFGFTKSGTGVLSGETTLGFVVGAEAGVQLFHTNAVNLELGVRAALVLSSNSLGRPSLWMAKVGLYF